MNILMNCIKQMVKLTLLEEPAELDGFGIQKATLEAQIGKGRGSNFQPKPFIPQRCQTFSLFCKPFAAQNSHCDQTNTTLMELVRDLKMDKL